MSDAKKGGIIAAVFAVIMAAAVLSAGYLIYKSPARISATTAGNYTANLMNGGYLLDDGDYIYYSVPGKQGIWCVKSDGTENERISETGDGDLQTDSGSYFFSDENKLVCTSSFGQNPVTLLEYAENPYVVGERVYYTDEDGYICKYLSWSGEQRKTQIKPAGQMIVYAGRIYYAADDGLVHKCALDGSDDKALEGVKAEKFSIDGKYLYALSDGVINSVAIGDERISVYPLCKADDFVVNQGYVMYNHGGKCLLAEINRLLSEENYEPTEILSENAERLQIGSDSFYIFTSDKIIRLPFETGKAEDFLYFE